MEVILSALSETDKLESNVDFIAGFNYPARCDLTGEICDILEKKSEIKQKRQLIYNRNNFMLFKFPLLSDEEFKSHFRLTRTTLEGLVNVLGPSLSHNSCGRPQTEIKKQVLMSIWILANQESFRGTADRFDMEPGLTHRVFMRFIIALYDKRHEFIIFPSGETLQIVKQGFQNLRNTPFPGACGCCDGCHIPIKQPVKDKQSFYNRNKYHSILLQGICDHRSVFTDVFAGWPGSSHDANVWKHSPIFKKLNNEALIPEENHLLGDSAYPISKFMQVPYRNNGHLTPEQKHFNKVLSSSRCVIEQAFGLLKCRFRRLKMLDMSRMDMLAKVVVVACILHNICLLNNDFIEVDADEFLEDLNENEIADGSDDGNAKRIYLTNLIAQQ